MTRPEYLPDFTDPPLDEVVLGVQFAPVNGYTSVGASRIWDVFRAEFPTVEEHPVLDPQFEMFGGANLQAGPRIHVGAPPVGSRLWFLSEDENHLLQFQPDRFISNWRRRPNTEQYPHFEGLAAAFEENLSRLSSRLNADFGFRMTINQAEVSYINVIPVERFSDASDWFALWDGGMIDIEGLNVSFNEVFRDQNGRPFARLNHQIQSVVTMDGAKKAFRFSLVFKGKPEGENMDSALRFLATGRDAIVMRFEETTTAKAQEYWGKIA